MAPVLRVFSIVLLTACVAMLASQHLPGFMRRPIERARAAKDPWAAYVAPESACPGRSTVNASPVAQDRTMVCMLDYARAQHGLRPLPVVYLLNRSSLLKAIDIVRCGDFSHTPCGHPFGGTFDAVGYHGETTTAEGENIAWGDGRSGSPLAVVEGWLNSSHHRENLFSGDWGEEGVAVFPVSRFLGRRDVEVWVSQFGSRS